MSEYKHNFHAGNLGDVLKHTILIEAVKIINKRKLKDESIFRYCETHSGQMKYILKSAAEGWSRGIKKIKKDKEQELTYLKIQGFPKREGDIYYSSWGMVHKFLVNENCRFYFDLYDKSAEVFKGVQLEISKVNDFKKINIFCLDFWQESIEKIIENEYDLILIDAVNKKGEETAQIINLYCHLKSTKTPFLIWYSRYTDEQRDLKLKTNINLSWVELKDSSVSGSSNMSMAGMFLGNFTNEEVQNIHLESKKLGSFVSEWTISSCIK